MVSIFEAEEEFKPEWINLSVQRGMTEIKTLFSLVRAYSGFIAGGYARYCLSPTKNPVPATDVDIFLMRVEDIPKLRRDLEARGAELLNETSTAITYTPPKDWFACPTIQIITAFTGSPHTILKDFDFTVTMAALVNETTGFTHADFPKDEFFRTLRVQHIICPVGNMRRAMKYIAKGYRLPVKEMLKFYKRWDEVTHERRADLDKLLEVPKGSQDESHREELRKVLYVD